MQPNIFFHEAFGKFLFILFDLLCGYLIVKINTKQSESSSLKAVLFWFYNPITIAISSRGNAESLMAFLVLTFVLLFKMKCYLMAGAFYALSIHFKIYPIIYGLALFLNIIKINKLKRLSCFEIIKSVVTNSNLWCFGLAFLATLSVLSILFFMK